jgi:ferredoxin-thioredoxin reductase catalytic chain
VKPPEICPTCGAKYAFVLCDRNEAMQIMASTDYSISSPAEVAKAWMDLTIRSDFELWGDSEAVKTLSEGVLENNRNKGLKYCPCRITTGDKEKDLGLICPCNFKSQKTWKEDGECWCGLFVRRK